MEERGEAPRPPPDHTPHAPTSRCHVARGCPRGSAARRPRPGWGQAGCPRTPRPAGPRSSMAARNRCAAWCRCGRSPWPGPARYSPVQPGMAQYSPVQPDTAQYSPARPGIAQYSPVRPGTAQYNSVRPGTARPGRSASSVAWQREPEVTCRRRRHLGKVKAGEVSSARRHLGRAERG